MKRVQLFEFEDFDWFPDTFRSTMTKLIVVMHRIFGTKEVLTNLLFKILNKSNSNKIVDIGAGSGGVMPQIIQHMNEKGNEKVELLLTDLHPNNEFVKQFNTSHRDHISYSEIPLDAANLSQAPEGIKTMVNSFHHMPPEIARKILQSAQDNKQTLLIYEMGENMLPLIVWWLLLPLSLTIMSIMAIILVLFIKPLNWKDILFSWFIPLIPLFFAWDGQASMPRTYTFEDVNELLPDSDDNYTWEVKHALKGNGKKLGYYILGRPL